MNLVLVESPAKAKTIEKYLGKEYKVKATVGHIIDLPKNKLGVDVDKKFAPEFEQIKGKGALIKKLKKDVPKDGKVYLAMDPDREGEAIAWHAAKALKLKDPLRVAFNEITKDAVVSAISNPRKIDQDLVDAQFARRVLDRLVGYKVSQVLWKKMWYGLSAGRVQSAALRLIVQREEEIEKFIPVEYWEINANLKKDEKNKLVAGLSKVNGKKASVGDGISAESIKKDIGSNDFVVTNVVEKEVKKHAFPPFTTSLLQQSANRVLGYGAKRTMGIAQSLYQSGYITYMRTDSTNLSAQSIDMIRKYIKSEFGDRYLPVKPNLYKTRSKNAQEAHEAIRPTDVALTPEGARAKMGNDEARLYALIWNRAVASQMSEKVSKSLSIEIKPSNTKEQYIFTVSAQEVLFDGFRKLLKGDSEDEELVVLENIKKGNILKLIELSLLQKFTKPKARYTEASLVKTLEALGIGRPSTYATIISTIIDRGYVVKELKALKPTDVGIVVCNFLVNHFNRLVNYEYTAGVENRLDEVSNGTLRYAPFIKSEYDPLMVDIEKADGDVKKEDVVVLGDSDEKCEICGGKMIIKVGKNGKFLSCSKFPECKGIKSLAPIEPLDEEKYLRLEKCDKCDSNMLLKSSKYGRFWACEKYPVCKNSKPLLLKEVCPECKSNLTEKKGRWGKTFIGCSGYPNCKYIKKVSKKDLEKEEVQE